MEKKHLNKGVKVMFGLFGENESGAALIGAVIRVVSKGRGGRRWDVHSGRL